MSLLRVYARIMGMLRPHLRTALLLSLANIVFAGLQFLDPLLFGQVIQMLSASDGMAPGALWARAVALLGLWAAVGVGGIGVNISAVLHAERLAHRCRLESMRRFYEHVLSLPLAFHGDAHSGRLMKTMLSGADTMFGIWLTFFREQLSTYVATLVLLPLTLLLNWRLGISLIVLVMVFCVLTVLVIRRTEAGQRRAEGWQFTLAGTAQDALANVTVMQSFGRLASETRRFGEIIQKVLANQYPVLTWWAVVSVLTRAASTVAVIAIVVVGTLLHLRGQASVGEIVSFMGLATMLIARLDGAMSFSTRLFLGVPGMLAYFEVLDRQTTVPERVGAGRLRPGPGAVTFEAVGFAYPGGPAILDGVSFAARPGQAVALVGPTGAGKSTVMALLQRLWDPQTGRILIDGQDLRQVTLESLRRAVGVVFQEAMLLNRTIRENLLIGRPEASQAELEAACHAADAYEFIIRQPQGFETLVGERGSTLSGGQRQRLAIARAILKDPPILILDEATSALDAATEARVTRALAGLMRGRTTFIIAHRLSTVRDADDILVFEGGRIVERGDFATLTAADGAFAALVATQLSPARGEAAAILHR